MSVEDKMVAAVKAIPVSDDFTFEELIEGVAAYNNDEYEWLFHEIALACINVSKSEGSVH